MPLHRVSEPAVDLCFVDRGDKSRLDAPELATQERLATTMAEIRKGFDEVEKAIDEIDKDESLVVNKFYKDGKGEEKKGG